MKHTINVTQRDIDKGEQGNTQSCPIARAMKRKFKTDSVRVGVYVASMRSTKTNEFGTKIIDLPAAATRFIVDFDGVQVTPVAPFKFEVEVND